MACKTSRYLRMGKPKNKNKTKTRKPKKQLSKFDVMRKERKMGFVK